MKAPRNEREAYFVLSKPVKRKPTGRIVDKTNTSTLLLIFAIAIVFVIACSIV